MSTLSTSGFFTEWDQYVIQSFGSIRPDRRLRFYRGLLEWLYIRYNQKITTELFNGTQVVEFVVFT